MWGLWRTKRAVGVGARLLGDSEEACGLLFDLVWYAVGAVDYAGGGVCEVAELDDHSSLPEALRSFSRSLESTWWPRACAS